MTKMGVENGRIDAQERDDARAERRLRELEAKNKKEMDTRFAEADVASEDTKRADAARLFAQFPKGWACVQKRLPRWVSIIDATDRDMAACEKAFNSKQK